MAIVKVIEVIGTSDKSLEDAIAQVVHQASQTVRHIRGVDIVHQTVHVEAGKIVEYRATCHVAFVVEHHGDLIGSSES